MGCGMKLASFLTEITCEDRYPCFLVLEPLTDVMQRVWGVENSGDELARNTTDGTSVDVHVDNPAEELNYRKGFLSLFFFFFFLHC